MEQKNNCITLVFYLIKTKNSVMRLSGTENVEIYYFHYCVIYFNYYFLYKSFCLCCDLLTMNFT